MKKIAVLGSTGSIGTQTLEIVRTNQDIEVTALAAGSNITLLEEQILDLRFGLAAAWDEDRAAAIKRRIRDLYVAFLSGTAGRSPPPPDSRLAFPDPPLRGSCGLLPPI